EAYWQWLRRLLAALRSEMSLTRMTLDRRRDLSTAGEEYLPFWDEQQWQQHEPLVSDIPAAAPYHDQLREALAADWPDEAAQGVGVASGFSVAMVERPAGDQPPCPEDHP
ncbi:MAG: hypothetical protein KKI08_16965, partial [Armatimonadetes bacterium]|nr:hypothetical protein [Armatimonadota bacterium]